MAFPIEAKPTGLCYRISTPRWYAGLDGQLKNAGGAARLQRVGVGVQAHEARGAGKSPGTGGQIDSCPFF